MKKIILSLVAAVVMTAGIAGTGHAGLTCDEGQTLMVLCTNGYYPDDCDAISSGLENCYVCTEYTLICWPPNS